ncbi:MAG: hypothetical protein M9953_03480 [Thermomicrobiales bacterium]|nr:hypothetical protein [Thermomicrobiales bacterium]MCO5218012.1 hypothetical protein [Thermomicrobiales bacterium]MCO5224379.1 hypothetical protein [Thermomicrobiales bacterium]MCO5228255.1 hypothetical protein [Thermomicrobiales bacterium]
MLTAPDAIMMALSEDGRRVLSNWRAIIYLRRAENVRTRDGVRWQITPTEPSDITPLIRRMKQSGLIESIPGATGCHLTVAPFASRFPVRERELLLELNPYAILTHFSALEYHSFTTRRPNHMTALSPAKELITPLGTSPDEWTHLTPPIANLPRKVVSQEVRWFRHRYDTSFGIVVARDGPVPIRISDPERTLVDALQYPDFSGGIQNVFEAWEASQDFVSIDLIVDYTNRYGIALLKQRVGYIAELVGHFHSVFDSWAAESKRGGSSKLVGTMPFSADFSARWNLSINAPVTGRN